MTCEMRRDNLLLYALGDLDAPEAAALRAHLETGCPACAGALAEAYATLGQLPNALDPVEPSVGAWDRLEKRLNAPPTQKGAVAASIGPRIAQAGAAPPRNLPLRYAAAALVGIAIGGGALFFASHQRIQHLHAQLDARKTRQEKMERTVAKDARQIKVLNNSVAAFSTSAQQLGEQLGQARAKQQQAEQLWARLDIEYHKLQSMVGEDRLTYVDLHRQPAQPDAAAGRVFWDKDTNQWHVYVFNLAPPAPGKGYELWAVTADKKPIPAGMLKVDASGRGSLVYTLPKDAKPIVTAAITDEPAAGSPAPTGHYQLLGKIQ